MVINGTRINSKTEPTNGDGKVGCRSLWCCNGAFAKKILWTLMGVLLVYVIFYVGTLIHNNIKTYQTIGQADKSERTITVNGTGKVTGSNDIAVTSIGYGNTDKDVALAQKNNKRVMDPIVAELRRLGIADKDLKTTYSIRPDYTTVPEKPPQLNGYRVESGVQVKIRDLSKIAAVLSVPGKYGATEVGDIEFSVYDSDDLKTLARDKALADAKAKAVQLAASLGVRLKEVVAYNEYEGSDYPIMYNAAPMRSMTDMVASIPSSGPDLIAAGSKEVVMNVSVTYEIVPMTYRGWDNR